MKIAQKQWAAFAALSVGWAAFGVAGCGSGGGQTTTQPGVVASGTNNTTSFITRADEPTLSDDAKILATRQATSAFVSLADARAFDADLAAIRAADPAVAGVHARLTYEPKSLLLIVKPTAPWISKWDASLAAPSTTTDTDLTTGEPALDALLSKYAATRTTNAYDFASGRYYLLRFGESLNMQAVAAEFAKSSANIVSAEVNGLLGDGDNIIYTLGTDATGKQYAFSQGYGDCLAGCINRYTRTYTLRSDGGISVTTTGTPPGSSSILPIK